MTDVLERLRAADPVVVEPEAPPVEWMLGRLEPAPVRRARRRPLLAGLAAVGGLAAAVAIIAGSPSRDVVAEASEALASDGAVVHTVYTFQQLDRNGVPAARRKYQFSRKPKRFGYSDLQTERWTAQSPRREHIINTIFAADGGADGVQQTEYADGVYHFEATWMKGGVHTFRVPKRFRENTDSPPPMLGATGTDPVADIRALLADKQLQPAGETVVDGRKLLTLRGTIPSKKLKSGFTTPEVRVEYLVDPESYEPVRVDQRPYQPKNGKLAPMRGFRVNFKTYERLPLTPANLGLLKLSR
ncbi:hypothetical protein [Solirubrobacter soli]|uniref:hypothetical protein n=1 Tax=Solirubrobacter soli TaxID=363832 RepID=UPI00041AD963|nr:hypothetical protein [Solirubrobacter soli]